MSFNWRHQYDDEIDEALGNNAATRNREPSLTQQQYTDEVNLNVMTARMGIHDGSLPTAAFDPKLFGTIQDFTDAPNLKEIFDRAHAARDMFMQLPASIRSKFANNPAVMMDWVSDPANIEEARNLGFFEKLPKPEALPPEPPKDT